MLRLILATAIARQLESDRALRLCFKLSNVFMFGIGYYTAHADEFANKRGMYKVKTAKKPLSFSSSRGFLQQRGVVNN